MSSLFKEFNFPKNIDLSFSDNIAVVKKWNWDYEDALAFQKKAQKFIQENRQLKIYIFCNHPHCFTLGRGNERGREDLLDFDASVVSNLSFKVHKIHRGGGITFHYPGQWIFYPIVDINQKQTLDDLMCWMLKATKSVLEELGIDKLLAAKKLVGVWREKKKLASIGLGLNRFVTEHGLALNLSFDEEMFKELIKINPCGMDSQTYISADQFIEDKNLLDNFHKKFIEKYLS